MLGFCTKIDDFNLFFFFGVINKEKIRGLVFCMFGMGFRFPEILDHGKFSRWGAY